MNHFEQIQGAGTFHRFAHKSVIIKRISEVLREQDK